MEMYGEMDRTRDGKIASEYPAWGQVTQCDALKEHINQIDISIRSGRVGTEEIHEAKQSKANLEKRLDDIMRSKPRPNDSERNLLFKHYKSFGSKIQETMFTRDDMKYGLASPREEARRMKKPCISLAPDECEIAISCNVMPDKNRKVSRDAATKVFKLLGKILGEPANVEVLRQNSKKEAHIPLEVAPVRPVAAQHLEATSTEATVQSAPRLNKDGKLDKRYKKKG